MNVDDFVAIPSDADDDATNNGGHTAIYKLNATYEYCTPSTIGGISHVRIIIAIMSISCNIASHRPPPPPLLRTPPQRRPVFSPIERSLASIEDRAAGGQGQAQNSCRRGMPNDIFLVCVRRGKEHEEGQQRWQRRAPARGLPCPEGGRREGWTKQGGGRRGRGGDRFESGEPR